MLEINSFNIKLNFKLDNGIYVFENESATGKSRLATLMHEYCAYGEPVNAYSFKGEADLEAIQKITTPGKYKAILLDRFDMYAHVCDIPFAQLATTTIVLVDCKQGIRLDGNERMCSINMTPYVIEVSL